MTFIERREQWPLRPMMMWSCRLTPTVFSALRTSRVSAMSSREGEGSPVGWLCAMMRAEAPSSSARFTTSRT